MNSTDVCKPQHVYKQIHHQYMFTDRGVNSYSNMGVKN